MTSEEKEEESSRKLIKDKLMVSEKELLKKLLEKVRRLVGFTSKGKIYFVPERSELTDGEKIGLYLVGKWFAYKAGIVKEAQATREELSNELGISKESVSARTSELKEKGYLDSPSRGQYKIIFAKIEDFVDRTLKGIEEGENEQR